MTSTVQALQFWQFGYRVPLCVPRKFHGSSISITRSKYSKYYQNHSYDHVKKCWKILSNLRIHHAFIYPMSQPTWLCSSILQ